DNIPQIAGLPVHPVQLAEQQRIAATLAQNAAASAEVVPAVPPESVKDMSSATRAVLEKLSAMLKEARPVAPGDAKKRPDRAEAPAPAPASGASPPSSLAAANAGNSPEPQNVSAPAPAEHETVLSAGPDDNAATPREARA